MTKHSNGRVPPGELAGLYPFPHAASSGTEAMLADVRRSTAEKAGQIAALRREVGRLYATRLAACAATMAAAFAAGGRLFAFGSGGSSTDAQSVASIFLSPPRGRPLPAFSLTAEVATIAAPAEVAFSRQLGVLGRPGDIAVGLSPNGGSVSVLAAFAEAGRRGLCTVGLAGHDGGRMAEDGVVEHLFVIPSSSVHRIQEAQTTVYHVLWELVQEALDDVGHVPVTVEATTWNPES